MDTDAFAPSHRLPYFAFAPLLYHSVYPQQPTKQWRMCADVWEPYGCRVKDYLEETNVQLGASYDVAKQSTEIQQKGLEAAAEFMGAEPDEVGMLVPYLFPGHSPRPRAILLPFTLPGLLPGSSSPLT